MTAHAQTDEELIARLQKADNPLVVANARELFRGAAARIRELLAEVAGLRAAIAQHEAERERALDQIEELAKTVAERDRSIAQHEQERQWMIRERDRVADESCKELEAAEADRDQWKARCEAAEKAAEKDAEAWRDSICLVPKGGYLIEIRHRTEKDELLANRKMLTIYDRPYIAHAFSVLLRELDAALTKEQ
jgi:hypothetical protein